MVKSFSSLKLFLKFVKGLNDSEIDCFLQLIKMDTFTSEDVELNYNNRSGANAVSGVIKSYRKAGIIETIKKNTKQHLHRAIHPRTLLKEELEEAYKNLNKEIVILEDERNIAIEKANKPTLAFTLSNLKKLRDVCEELIGGKYEITLIYSKETNIKDYFNCYEEDEKIKCIEGNVDVLLFKNGNNSGIIHLCEDIVKAGDERIWGHQIYDEHLYDNYMEKLKNDTN